MDLFTDVADVLHDVVEALEQLPMVGAAFGVASRIFRRVKDVQVGAEG